MPNPSPWILCIWFWFSAATKKSQHIRAWQMRGGQKAIIACKSRRPNRLKVLQTACIVSKSLQAEDDLMEKQSLLTFKILNFSGCFSSTPAPYFDFYSSVFFIWDFKHYLNSAHRLQRDLYKCFHLLPARLPSCWLCPAACTAVVQGCRYLGHIWPVLPDRQLLSLGDYSLGHVIKGSPARSWGVENFATVQSTGSSSFPSLHTILVKAKDFLAVLKVHKL